MRNIRQRIRKLRRDLSPHQQRLHNQHLNRRLRQLPAFIRSHRIAFYMSTDGEIDPSHSLATALQQRKSCFLPALRPLQPARLWFIQHSQADDLITNRFGIQEPDIKHTSPTPPWGLDLIIMPLVAFDKNCNRLGMGSGYYDRTFSFLRHRTHWKKPQLIGIAHECQKVSSIKPNRWDIGLSLIITERNIYYPK